MKAIDKIKTSREPGPNSVQFDENMHFTQTDMLTQEDSEEMVAFIKENLPAMLSETCYAHTLTHVFQHDKGQTQKFMFAASKLRDDEGKPLFELKTIGDQMALVCVGDLSSIGAGAEIPEFEEMEEVMGEDEIVDDDDEFNKASGTDEGGSEADVPPGDSPTSKTINASAESLDDAEEIDGPSGPSDGAKTGDGTVTSDGAVSAPVDTDDSPEVKKDADAENTGADKVDAGAEASGASKATSEANGDQASGKVKEETKTDNKKSSSEKPNAKSNAAKK